MINIARAIALAIILATILMVSGAIKFAHISCIACSVSDLRVKPR